MEGSKSVQGGGRVEPDMDMVMSAAKILCIAAHRTNADTMRMQLDNLSTDSEDLGTFRIIVKRLKKKES